MNLDIRGAVTEHVSQNKLVSTRGKAVQLCDAEHVLEFSLKAAG